ncbi:FAD-dependent oxidoreductase [Ensifer canadensis]
MLQPIMALGSRIDRLHGADARSGRTVLDVRYDALAGGRFGLAVQRAALFGVLHDAVTAAGIAIRTGMTLTAAKTSGEKAVLTDAAGQEAGRYDLVIDATGAARPLRRVPRRRPACASLPMAPSGRRSTVTA